MLLTNIRQFTEMEVVLLFSEHDFTVPMHFRKKYGCSVFTFTDNRDDKTYIPAIRPYLWWQYLAANPEAENETYLYIDSDIIFREWLDFATLVSSPNVWIGSNCSGYINYDYLIKCKNGPAIVSRMAEICGITVEAMKTVPGIGAQLIITNPTAAFWERSYRDSNTLYGYLNGLDSNVQKWTAEMWAQLWGMAREGKTLLMPHEMDFCRPTDDIAEWDKVKIMHNAGVTGLDKLFFKGKYVDIQPFGEDFSQVPRDKVSYKYVQAIEKVVR